MYTLIPSLMMIFHEFFYFKPLPPLMYRSGAIFMKIDYFRRKNNIFYKKYRCFFTNAHPIHAIFMILRQREAPLILRVSGMVLTGICMVFIGFMKDFPNFPDRAGPDRTGPGWTAPDRTGPDRTRPDRTLILINTN